ncbi:thioesterase family protein [Oceanibium sediminis]|uniref:thioesterase family protein n=1 Tax=Oceanibium sediminis TaxID=2026339 RepID=UPI000DD2BBE6|nr:thioesterase family protein [Oceanibium sediminis]
MAEVGPAPPGAPVWSGIVRPAWIDRNGHMNVTAYDAVFQEAEQAFFQTLGVERSYAEQDRRGFFRLEKHLRYQAECLAGQLLEVTVRLLWTDFKRFHLFYELWQPEAGRRAATCELMWMHMDLTARRGLKLAEGPLRDAFAAYHAREETLPPVDGASRAISPDPRVRNAR